MVLENIFEIKINETKRFTLNIYSNVTNWIKREKN